jgi:hypothetical protein
VNGIPPRLAGKLKRSHCHSIAPGIGPKHFAVVIDTWNFLIGAAASSAIRWQERGNKNSKNQGRAFEVHQLNQLSIN